MIGLYSYPPTNTFPDISNSSTIQAEINTVQSKIFYSAFYKVPDTPYYCLFLTLNVNSYVQHLSIIVSTYTLEDIFSSQQDVIRNFAINVLFVTKFIVIILSILGFCLTILTMNTVLIQVMMRFNEFFDLSKNSNIIFLRAFLPLTYFFMIMAIVLNPYYISILQSITLTWG